MSGRPTIYTEEAITIVSSINLRQYYMKTIYNVSLPILLLHRCTIKKVQIKNHHKFVQKWSKQSHNLLYAITYNFNK